MRLRTIKPPAYYCTFDAVRAAEQQQKKMRSTALTKRAQMNKTRFIAAARCLQRKREWHACNIFECNRRIREPAS